MVILFIAAVAVGCETHEQRPEEAFERVKEGRGAIMDTAADKATGTLPAPAKAKEAKPRPVAVDAQTQFATDTEKQLAANDATIKELKGMPDNAKILKKISLVEKDNAALRVELAAYLAKAKLDWETYKAKTLAEMAKVTADLKSIREQEAE